MLTEACKLGNLELKNGLIMASLTRMRGEKDGTPNDLMKEYYEQRAEGFGLILTECTGISPLSNAFPGCGHIFNESHVEGWKKIVDAVHDKGSKIYL